MTDEPEDGIEAPPEVGCEEASEEGIEGEEPGTGLPPPEPLGDEDDLTGTKVSVEIRSDNISAETIKQAGILIEQLHVTSASSVAVKLSMQHFRRLSLDDLKRCEGELVFENAAVAILSQTLERKRLLILSGDPESGKGSTALLAASALARRGGCKGTLSCPGLDAAVSVDLDEISGTASFERQVILLEDALAGENPDLTRLLRTLDPLRYGTLSERLRKNRSAIILTISSHAIEPFKAGLESLGILHRMELTSLELRKAALRRFVEVLPMAGAPRECLMEFLAANEENLARELVTIPRIARFVREYLREVADEKLTLRQALSRMDDLSQWLMHDLAGDLDAQSAVLALVLGSPTLPASGVPWFAFDRLRRRILGRLRQELRMPDNQPLDPQELGRGSLFLERARARVLTMPAPLPDLVQFKDDRYPQRLWHALLGSGRSLATILVPMLEDLSGECDGILRVGAARALGRMGQIDPLDKALPCLQSWIYGREQSDDRAAAFLQGASASEDVGYRDFCLGAIRHLVSQEDADSAAAAVRALRLIGRPDPSVPLAELRRIGRQHLPVQTKLLRTVAAEIGVLEGEIRQKSNPRRMSAELKALHVESQKVMAPALVSAKRLPILGAFQYSLAGILFAQGGDPWPVLKHLISWMKTESESLGPIVAYLLLQRKGLIDLLDRHKWISGSFGQKPCSRFLLSASRGSEEATGLQELLERAFCSLRIFPGLFRSALEKRFLQILRSWSEEGCVLIGLRPTVIGLLSGLLASQDSYIRETIDRFLRTDPHFAVKGSRLRALAIDTLNGEGLKPVPLAPSRPRRLPAWLKKANEESG